MTPPNLNDPVDPTTVAQYEAFVSDIHKAIQSHGLSNNTMYLVFQFYSKQFLDNIYTNSLKKELEKSK